MTHFIFYHHPCSDGMMAATIAFEYLSQKNQQVIMIPSPPAKFPTTLPSDYHEPTFGDTIYLLDTCFETKILEKLSKQIGKNVIVLDHHEYSRTWINSFCDGVHDINRAGCRLAWDYFFTDLPTLDSVLYINDRDLWKWEHIPQSKQFNDYFYTMVPITQSAYRPFVFGDFCEELISDAIKKGILLGDYVQMQINEICHNVGFRIWQNHKTAVVNSNMHVSEVSSQLLSTKDVNGDHMYDCAFVWSKNEKTQQIKVSLRSRKNDDGNISADVNQLASKFGGGGHKMSSGFVCADLNSVFAQ